MTKQNSYLILINKKFDIKIILLQNLINWKVYNSINYNNFIDLESEFEIKYENEFYFRSRHVCEFNTEKYLPNSVNRLSHGSVVFFKRNKDIYLTIVYIENLKFGKQKYKLDHVNKEHLTHYINDHNILCNGKPFTNSNLKTNDIIVLKNHFLFCFHRHLITLSDKIQYREIDYDSFQINRNDNNLVIESISVKNRMKDVSLVINPGEMVAILGGSGVGKSTLMDIITNKLKVDKGKVFLSESGKLQPSDYGKVFQKDDLLDLLTVEETLNRYADILCKGMSKKLKKKNIQEMLDTFDLRNLRKRTVNNLSGGEKKRVCIACALLNQPKLLFLDEPDSSLSPDITCVLLNTLKSIKERNKTIIFVITHKVDRIEDFYDKVIILAKEHKNDGTQTPAQLVYYGTPKNSLTFFDEKDLLSIYNKLNVNSNVKFYVNKWKKVGEL